MEGEGCFIQVLARTWRIGYSRRERERVRERERERERELSLIHISEPTRPP